MTRDNMTNRDWISRRKYLTTAGVVGTGLLAGCSGDGGDGSDGGDSSDGSDGNGDVSDGSDGNGDSSDGGDGSDGESREYPKPDEEIEIIQPFSAGGGFAYFARTTAPAWEEYLPGNPEVVVLDQPGGGGVTGSRQVYRADPDGHTILHNSPWVLLPQQIGQGLDLDYREMSHIGAITVAPSALVLRTDLGIENWDEFASAMANGDITVGTSARGGAGHIYPLITGEITGEWAPDDVSFVHAAGDRVQLMRRGDIDLIYIGGVTSGISLANAIDNAEVFLTMSSPDGLPESVQQNTANFATEFDIPNVEDVIEITGLRRVFSGPPGVPDEILETQIEAFSQIINDEEILEQTAADDRPMVNPATAPDMDLSGQIENIYQTLTSDPYQGILTDALG